MFKCSQTSTCSETNYGQQQLVLKNVESKPTKINYFWTNNTEAKFQFLSFPGMVVSNYNNYYSLGWYKYYLAHDN